MTLATRNAAFLLYAAQLCLQCAQASQIAAFINGGYKAPQVAMYDSASDSILYSLCNSKDVPVFPGDKSAAFELQPQFPPTPGTHVSLIGYADDKGKLQTQLFYQTKDGHIVEALYQCNDTGYYVPSNGSDKPAFKLTDVKDIAMPKKPTDLTALLLGDDGGIRVHYKSEKQSSVYSIKYKSKEKNRWVNAGASQPLPTVGNIAAGFAVTDKITVVTPTSDIAGGQQSMFISSAVDDEKAWAIDTVPVLIHAANVSDNGNIVPVMSNMTTDPSEYQIQYDTRDPKWSFDALDPLAAPLGLTFGTGEMMSIFYIGKDKALHQVRREENSDKSFRWSNATRPDAKAWPTADDVSAHFGVAYDAQADSIWVYYMSNKTMMQLQQPTAGQWKEAVALPKTQKEVNESSGGGGGGGGLSKGAKLGVGIGVGLGVPLLLALIAAYVFYHSRKSRRNRAAENAALHDAHAAAVAPPSHPGSPAPRYTSGFWQPGPGQQPHDGPWSQHQPGVPYSDQNGYIKPESGYGWGNGAPGDQKLQQHHYSGQMPPHQSPPAQTQPVFEMGNNQVVPPPQEMSGETTAVNERPSPHPK
ncbi:hypothetical protein PG989_006377 [Apiospora arundinis]